MTDNNSKSYFTQKQKSHILCTSCCNIHYNQVCGLHVYSFKSIVLFIIFKLKIKNRSKKQNKSCRQIYLPHEPGSPASRTTATSITTKCAASSCPKTQPQISVILQINCSNEKRICKWTRKHELNNYTGTY